MLRRIDGDPFEGKRGRENERAEDGDGEGEGIGLVKIGGYPCRIGVVARVVKWEMTWASKSATLGGTRVVGDLSINLTSSSTLERISTSTRLGTVSGLSEFSNAEMARRRDMAKENWEDSERWV